MIKYNNLNQTLITEFQFLFTHSLQHTFIWPQKEMTNVSYVQPVVQKTFQFIGGINLFLCFTLKFTSVAANLFNPPLPLPPSFSLALYIFTFTQYKATWPCSNTKNSFDHPFSGSPNFNTLLGP